MPDNIITHTETNDAPYKKENVLYEELKKIKDLIITHHHNCKNICISCPIVCADNKKTNNVLKKIYRYIKNEKKRMLFFIITLLNLIFIEMLFILRVTGLLC